MRLIRPLAMTNANIPREKKKTMYKKSININYGIKITSSWAFVTRPWNGQIRPLILNHQVRHPTRLYSVDNVSLSLQGKRNFTCQMYIHSCWYIHNPVFFRQESLTTTTSKNLARKLQCHKHSVSVFCSVYV